jgi:hypothetical protein
MIATPSASVTTPTSSGAADVDGPDEHRHVGIVGLECSPAVSKCVQHVVIDDTVLAGARLEFPWLRRWQVAKIVNMC